MIDSWEANNTKIVTWINNFVEHSIDTRLAKYDTLIPLTSIGFVVTLHLSLLNVYLILKLTLNLVSVSQLCDYNDCLVIFSSLFFYCIQVLQSYKLIETGRRKKRTIYLG